jgi:hypothetical protein
MVNSKKRRLVRRFAFSIHHSPFTARKAGGNAKQS